MTLSWLRFPLTLGAALLFGCALAQGGPPLRTDDPGTPGNRKWEINIAWIGAETRSRRETEFPSVDLNYGAGERVQLTAEAPWVTAREGGITNSGIGNGSVAVKWRFQDAKGSQPALSIFPRVGGNLSARSVRLGLAEPETTFLFPVEAQWELKHLSVNAEFGVLGTPGIGPGWIGGLAFGTVLDKNEYLAEIHGEGQLDSSEHEWIGQLGLRHEFSEQAVLLLAFGKSLQSRGVEATRWTGYLGIQLRF